MMIGNPLGTPAERCAWVFRQEMEPCPKCGSFELRYQVPIVLPGEVGDTPKELVSAWAKATRSGSTELEGVAYLQCGECLCRGPVIDVSGRTSEDVRSDPVVAQAIKDVWNKHSADIRAAMDDNQEKL
jgi:hypothetical protein